MFYIYVGIRNTELEPWTFPDILVVLVILPLRTALGLEGRSVGLDKSIFLQASCL